MSKKIENQTKLNLESTQQQIFHRFGMDTIIATKDRLCIHCYHYNPFVYEDLHSCKYRLIPLTLSGNDCPYFSPPVDT